MFKIFLPDAKPYAILAWLSGFITLAMIGFIVLTPLEFLSKSGVYAIFLASVIIFAYTKSLHNNALAFQVLEKAQADAFYIPVLLAVVSCFSSVIVLSGLYKTETLYFLFLSLFGVVTYFMIRSLCRISFVERFVKNYHNVQNEKKLMNNKEAFATSYKTCINIIDVHDKYTKMHATAINLRFKRYWDEGNAEKIAEMTADILSLQATLENRQKYLT